MLHLLVALVAEDLDVVMPMCNLIEYSESYRKIIVNLWNYCRDVPNNYLTDNCNVNPIINSAFFKYKNNFTAKALDNDNVDNNTKDVVIIVSLKYLSNFWRMLDMPLINYEMSLILTWSNMVF